MLFNKYIPQALCQEQDDYVIFVDSNWQDQTSYAFGRILLNVPCRIRARRSMRKVYLKQLGSEVAPNSIHGVWMGFLKLSPGAATQVDTLLVELLAQPGNRKAGIPHLLQTLLRRDYPIRVLYTVGHWLDVNSLDDVVQAGNF